MPQSIGSTIPRYIDESSVMAQKYTYHTNEHFWGETFYTDRRLSIISDISMPGMVEDEDSEASCEDDYHLSSAKLFDSYHEQSLRAASTLLTQVNRTYARENHHYPSFPPSGPAGNRSTRRNSNVLKTLKASSPNEPRPADRAFGTWPLRNDSNQHISTSRRPSLERYSTEPPAFGPNSCPETSSVTATATVLGASPPNDTEPTSHERSYFEYSDDEEDSEEDGIGRLTGKAMKRLHIRSSSTTKIGEIKGGSLRRFFRSKKL